MKQLFLQTFFCLTYFCLSSICEKAMAQKKLSIDQIMEGEKFIGYAPSRIFWAEDGSKVYFHWNPKQAPQGALYGVKIRDGKVVGKPEKISKNELANMPDRFGNYNKARTQKVYTQNGDVYWHKNGKIRQITHTTAQESNVSFSGDEKSLVYQQGNNLFEWSLSDGSLKQLTNFKSGNPRHNKKTNKQDQWLKDQQMVLMDVLKKRQKEQAFRKKNRQTPRPKRPKVIYLKGKYVNNLQLSPSKNFVTFRLSSYPDRKRTSVMQFITKSGYTNPVDQRPKVGSPQTSYAFGIFDLKANKVKMVDFEQLAGIYDLPAYYKEYGRKPGKKKARKVIPHSPIWSADGKKAVMVIRSQDSKDRWIVLLNASTGKLKLLNRQRNEAWIGGPGISWNFFMGNVGWMPDNQRVYFQSEKTGYSHLYTVNVNNGKTKALTQGKFEVTEAWISRDKKWWYLRTNEVHPGVYHVYKMPLKGGKRTQITTKTGFNNVTLSPDETQAAVLYSNTNTPPELYLMPNKAKAQAVKITDSRTSAFKQYAWLAPEIISFKARDGATVYARVYRPKTAPKQGKAAIFVHGAGYLQNAHKGWSSYDREYLFHNFLVQNGYTVMDIDYRGSRGYGRDWRTGIYRHMGGKDLTDNVDGAKVLVDRYNIDPNKIGIYGGSYGGFITLMAMFTTPDVFKAGAALRSVTDWAHYNHPYTNNILNTPVLDSIAYARSSPIYFAEGLKGALLMCHGMIDYNVQFQDIVRLSQRLIELRKEDWELAVYPIERHSFVEPTSWADEYKRIFKLFEENLK
ncbi:S9 family peptidase [Microscilla marina]|uniref:Dipeptidyl-peptidase n=1 Tax=Microscilla marina ATCC 23134 TaxID=313606 RepID=A1ZL59_MICM2|nr:prolyl oligopeptidase family serine peptidase [Microscilla marina]EAY29025.1 dipeptidyl-peptidase [Microscilla marina ATCC 23134]